VSDLSNTVQNLCLIAERIQKMIVRSHRVSSFKLLVACQGSIVPAITWKLIVAGSVGVLATLVHLGYLGPLTSDAVKFTMGPFTSLGVAISLFLGFYNNASYGRWWEARGYWGRQIIIIRDLARFLILLNEGAHQEHERDKGNGNSPSKRDNTTTNNVNISRRVSPSNNSMNCDVEVFNADGSDLEQQPRVQRTSEVKVNQQKKKKSANTTFTEKEPPLSMATYDYSEGFQDDDWVKNLIRLSIAQTHALRAQLRPVCKFDGSNIALDDRNRFLTPFELVQIVDKSRNPANAILLHASKILGAAYRRSQKYQQQRQNLVHGGSDDLNQHENNMPSILLDSYTMVHISQHIELLCDMQTSCERIHNTPMPLAYSLLIQRTTVLYTVLLPFAIAEAMGWWTPVFTIIVAYTFFGLDELARQIQEPFRDEPMCLALSAMSRVCEIDALEAMGEPTPPPLQRQGKVLM
jgi:predicted membrane chloride channel (bestrophin family)